MRVAKARYTGFLLALSLLIASHAMAGGIRDTKHNLSISGPGPIKAATEDRICIFCHTPHRSGPAVTHLWSRSTETEYTPYDSSTLDAAVRQPTGASRICLSCHDGTIALGAVGSEAQAIVFSGGIRQMPPGPSNLGTDLSDDHPVSITYDPLLMTDHHELTDPEINGGPGDGSLLAWCGL